MRALRSVAGSVLRARRLSVVVHAVIAAQIRAPLQLREFASGVKVVQAASHNDERICQRLAAMVRPAAAAAAEGGGMPTEGSSSAHDAGERLWLPMLGPALTQQAVASARDVPLAVAGEHLATAEARGVLCRDDGPEGLRYFRNFFVDAAAAAG